MPPGSSDRCCGIRLRKTAFTSTLRSSYTLKCRKEGSRKARLSLPEELRNCGSQHFVAESTEPARGG